MDLIAFIFFGIPALSLLFFIYSLISYSVGRNREKQSPGSIGPEELQRRKRWLIVTGITAAVIVGAAVWFIATLMIAIAHM